MGPHPAVAEVRRAVRIALEEVTGPVLVACSGGADSVALAAATAFESDRAGRPAGLVTIDHGLQQGSGEQAARVAQLGYELGLDPVEIVSVSVGTAAGPEAAARAARYTALDAVAAALDAHLLLAHTLDDQAETVLIGLGRGSGPRSIAGMRARDGRYLRPLLAVRRARTEAACAALGLPVWHDPHNDDPSFQRVRVRHEVMPLLEEVLQGGVAQALARTAELVREDLDALESLINSPYAADDPPQALEVVSLADRPRAVRTRLLRAWAYAHGAGPLTAVHTAALDALVIDWHGQGPLDLPGGRRVARASGRLEITPAESPGKAS